MAVPEPRARTLAMVLSKLQQVRTRQKEGGVSFEAITYDYFVPLLHAVVPRDDALSSQDRLDLLHKAIMRIAMNDRMTAAGLKRAAADVVREHMEAKPREYVLVTEVSISSFDRVPRQSSHGVSITFTPSLPRRFDRSHALKRSTELPFPGIPQQYTFVRCRCRARTPHEAAERALLALDLLRGLWNWQLNFGQFQIRLGGALAPINSIRLGPIHTLHDPKGKPASGLYWYSALPLSPRTGVSLRQHWGQLHKGARWASRHIRQVRYAGDLEGAFIAYTRALDEWIPDTAFMKLWAVLERLTGSEREPQWQRIKRVAFLFRKPDDELEILTQLKDYRNEMVHRDYSSPAGETFVYQLKRYVEYLLHFHLTWGRRFASLDEATAFLDLPADSAKLADAIDNYRLALRYRTPRKRRTGEAVAS